MLRILVTKQEGDDKRGTYLGCVMVYNRIVARTRVVDFDRAAGPFALMRAVLDQVEREAEATGTKLNFAAWQ